MASRAKKQIPISLDQLSSYNLRSNYLSGTKIKNIIGWIAVIITTGIAAFWAFWGSIENFHEGWYYHNFWTNIAMMFGQYLAPMFIFIIFGIIAIRWGRVGGCIMVLFGLWLHFFFFSTPASLTMIMIPMIIIGAAYFFGQPEPKKWAYRVTVIIPLLVMLGCGIEPAMRVAGRIDDGIKDARIIEGNGITLMWAPAGPGWADTSVNWNEAKDICAHMTEDGLGLSDTALNIWRLPSREEAVRSMMRHGKNCSGYIDPETDRPVYEITPDKESPLWDIYCKRIYWWTADEINSDNAWMIVYHGQTFPRYKYMKMGSLAFRAVKDIQ